MSHRPADCRLAIATCADLADIQPDDTPLVHALEQQGITTTVCVWNDPTVDWSAFDAVLIRTIWDYFRYHADFLGWLDRLDRAGVPTINDSALLRWNSDKRYLLELAARDVPVIPTRLAAASELPATLASMAGQSVVIKPTISGGAWHTVRGVAGSAELADAVAGLPHEFDYLVQPFVLEVVSDGEWSLLYFGGAFSHAVIKRPAHGDYRVQGEHGGSAEPATPDADILAAAEHALATVAAIGHADHAYVRVDGVVSNGRFLVMELELIEPFLHLAVEPAAAGRLAGEVLARLPATARNHAAGTH